MPATLMGTSVAVGATTGFRSAWKGAMKLLGILLAATAMTMLSSQVFATTTCERPLYAFPAGNHDHPGTNRGAW